MQIICCSFINAATAVLFVFYDLMAW